MEQQQEHQTTENQSAQREMTREEIIAAWEAKSTECEEIKLEVEALRSGEVLKSAQAEIQSLRAAIETPPVVEFFAVEKAESSNLKLTLFVDGDDMIIEAPVSDFAQVFAHGAASADESGEVERLKQELRDVREHHLGIMRFLQDPTNSQSQKNNVLTRELARAAQA